LRSFFPPIVSPIVSLSFSNNTPRVSSDERRAMYRVLYFLERKTGRRSLSVALQPDTTSTAGHNLYSRTQPLQPDTTSTAGHNLYSWTQPLQLDTLVLPLRFSMFSSNVYKGESASCWQLCLPPSYSSMFAPRVALLCFFFQEFQFLLRHSVSCLQVQFQEEESWKKYNSIRPALSLTVTLLGELLLSIDLALQGKPL
jgi:hypothetical protein